MANPVIECAVAGVDAQAEPCTSGTGQVNVAVEGLEVVKQVIDRKGPLKGKGGALAQWRREALERLASVHQAMDSLAQTVRGVKGRRWNLNVYTLRAKARQLRWRETGAERRHALWERIEPELSQLPPGLAQWYRETEELAQILNHKEQVARYELKTVARLLNGKPRVARTYTGE